MPGRAQTAVPEQKTMTLEDLQQMALQNNPTFAQSAANIHAAEGRKKQAGLYPNPTVGYQGEQIRGGSLHGGEQGLFVQQDIVLNGKLGLNRTIFDQELKQAETESEEQKVRVVTNVRMSYIQALAASRHWSCTNTSASLPTTLSRPPISSRMSDKRTLPTCSKRKWKRNKQD
jgi:cobalt-zinc-cadmium efflux system outer membrane protein